MGEPDVGRAAGRPAGLALEEPDDLDPEALLPGRVLVELFLGWEVFPGLRNAPTRDRRNLKMCSEVDAMVSRVTNSQVQMELLGVAGSLVAG